MAVLLRNSGGIDEILYSPKIISHCNQDKKVENTEIVQPTTLQSQNQDIWEMTRPFFVDLKEEFEREMHIQPNEKIKQHSPQVVSSIASITSQWTLKHRLISEKGLKTLNESMFTDFMSKCYPKSSEGFLLWVSKFVTANFIFDDRAEKFLIRDKECLLKINERNLAVFKGAHPQEKDDPLTFAFYDLRNDLRNMSSENWMKHFIKEFQNHQDSFVEESSNQTEGFPTLERYRNRRRYTGAVYLYLAFAEVAANINLKDEDRKNPMIIAINETCTDIINFSNDVISAPKEPEKDGNNSIYVIKHHEKCTMEEAILQSTKECSARIKDFVNLKDTILSSETFSQDAKVYIEWMCDWLIGYFQWSLITKRYMRPTLCANQKV